VKKLENTEEENTSARPEKIGILSNNVHEYFRGAIMTTLFLHHYFVPQKSYFGCAYLMNFHEDFDQADHIGTEAIQETYHRLFDIYKGNRTMLRELSHVLNHRLMFWDQILKQEPENPKPVEFLRIYLELFYKTHHYLTRQNFYGKRENWQIIE
jgi:hypothetical protein